MSIYGDLVKLAAHNGGRIPREIPTHFVHWAVNELRVARGRPARPFVRTAPPGVILARAGG